MKKNLVGKLSLTQRLVLIAASASVAIVLVIGGMIFMASQYKSLMDYLLEHDMPAQEHISLAYIEYADINNELFKLLEKNQSPSHDNGAIYKQGRALADRLELLEQRAEKEKFGLSDGQATDLTRDLLANLHEYKNNVIMALEMVLADRDMSLLYSSKISGHFYRTNQSFIHLQEFIREDIKQDVGEKSQDLQSQLLLLGGAITLLVLALVGFLFWVIAGVARQHRYLADDLNRLRQGDTTPGNEPPIADPAFAPLQAALDAFRKTLRDLHGSEQTLAEKNQALEAHVLALAQMRDTALRASEAKTRFMSTMSHELRTPINGFLGMSQLLAETRLDEEQQDMLNTAIQSAQHLHRLIENILDFSNIEHRPTPAKTAAFNLRRVVDDLVNSYAQTARDKNLDLQHAIAEDLPERVVGDASRLRQILDNLLGNAIKFTLNGQVSLQVEGCGDGKPSQCIRFTVQDTGIGIADEHKESIFDPFLQIDSALSRRYDGMGLGLAVTKALVKQAGGGIHFDSRLEAGTTFYVELPLPAEAEAKQAPQPAKTEQAEAGSLRFLVVEDNQLNRTLAQAMLTKLGHECSFAVNGQEALQAMDENNYDIVIMDCQMPVMDGYEATRYIRQKEAGKSRIPILAITANAMTGDRERCLDAGMDEYLSKPYTIDQLKEKIGVLLKLQTRRPTVGA